MSTGSKAGMKAVGAAMKASFTGGKLSVEERNALIMKHREQAQRMACALLRRWGAHLTPDELTSAVDLALCEAALRYAPRPGAAFATYLFYFLKGEVIRSLTAASGQSVEESHDARVNDDESGYHPSVEEELPSEDEAAQMSSLQVKCPERETYLGELRAVCKDALAQLSTLERKIIVESHVEERDMVSMAKRLGYSRGHLFAIRKSAERKVRRHFEESDTDFDLAA
jgi:RNA polymerase sigma factor (sigma-70 family)